jgi:hypothetical protein
MSLSHLEKTPEGVPASRLAIAKTRCGSAPLDLTAVAVGTAGAAGTVGAGTAGGGQGCGWKPALMVQGYGGGSTAGPDGALVAESHKLYA